MLKLVLSGSRRYLMFSRDKVDGIQQVTLSPSGQQKPKIQGSYKEYQPGKESGLEFPVQLSSYSNPNTSPPSPWPGTSLLYLLSEPPSFPFQREKCPHAVQAAGAFSENQPSGTVSLLSQHLVWDPVSSCSACAVDPILPTTHIPMLLPPPAEGCPLLCPLTPPKALLRRSSVFSALSSHNLGCCWTCPPCDTIFPVPTGPSLTLQAVSLSLFLDKHSGAVA